jgi:hypothetical protein
MATKRFCDICDKQLTAEDDIPFVRELKYTRLNDGLPSDQAPKAIAYVAITNEENHPLTDVCSGCKLRIVTDGSAPETKTVATLQPMVAQDSPTPVALFALPKTPPKILERRSPEHQQPQPIQYEPSIPVHHEQHDQ